MQTVFHLLEDAAAIEQQIIRKGIALNIDWQDHTRVAMLAREALAYHLDRRGYEAAHVSDDARDHRVKIELFGLAALMLRTMEQMAYGGVETHGGDVWKTFARAIWDARQAHLTH